MKLTDFALAALVTLPGCGGSPAPSVPASARQAILETVTSNPEEISAACFAALDDCLAKVRTTEAAALMAQTTFSDTRASVHVAWKTSIAALSVLDDQCPPGIFFHDPTYREMVDQLRNAQYRTAIELKKIR